MYYIYKSFTQCFVNKSILLIFKINILKFEFYKRNLNSNTNSVIELFILLVSLGENKDCFKNLESTYAIDSIQQRI